METYVVKGEATDPTAQSLRVWLDARQRLEVAVEPIFRRPKTPVDVAAVSELRAQENLAWQHFRTARLMEGSER